MEPSLKTAFGHLPAARPFISQITIRPYVQLVNPARSCLVLFGCHFERAVVVVVGGTALELHLLVVGLHLR